MKRAKNKRKGKKERKINNTFFFSIANTTDTVCSDIGKELKQNQHWTKFFQAPFFFIRILRKFVCILHGEGTIVFFA